VTDLPLYHVPGTLKVWVARSLQTEQFGSRKEGSHLPTQLVTQECQKSVLAASGGPECPVRSVKPLHQEADRYPERDEEYQACGHL
jgi:hypothetical protein